MTDDRLAWEDHELDVEQLDMFAPEEPNETHPGAYDEPQPRVRQLRELPGTEWEHIFGDAA